MTRLTAATKAFRKPDVITDPDNLDADWNQWDSRRVRYDIFWAFYENTVYDEVTGRTWPKAYKTQYGLYKYIRNIYNPSYRLGEFWKAHLWAGALEDIPIAFPAAVADENLLAAIHQIWAWSNWQVKKDIVPLYGSVLGDVGILIVDDTTIQKMGEGSLGDISPGQSITVSGERQEDGSIEATGIFVTPGFISR